MKKSLKRKWNFQGNFPAFGKNLKLQIFWLYWISIHFHWCSSSATYTRTQAQRRLYCQATVTPRKSSVPQARGAPASRAAGAAEFPGGFRRDPCQPTAGRALENRREPGTVPAGRSAGHDPRPDQRCGARAAQGRGWDGAAGRGRRAGGTEAPGEASGARRPPTSRPFPPAGDSRASWRAANFAAPAPSCASPAARRARLRLPGAPRCRGAERAGPRRCPGRAQRGPERRRLRAAAAAPRGSRCAAPQPGRGTAWARRSPTPRARAAPRRPGPAATTARTTCCWTRSCARRAPCRPTPSTPCESRRPERVRPSLRGEAVAVAGQVRAGGGHGGRPGPLVGSLGTCHRPSPCRSGGAVFERWRSSAGTAVPGCQVSEQPVVPCRWHGCEGWLGLSCGEQGKRRRCT